MLHFAEMVKYPFQRSQSTTKIEDIWDGERYSTWIRDKSMLGYAQIFSVHSFKALMVIWDLLLELMEWLFLKLLHCRCGQLWQSTTIYPLKKDSRNKT